jgi:polysaccharide biosynthesis transport protein
MDIAYLLRVLWRRKFIILAITALAAVLAFAFSLMQPKFYTSAAQYSTGAGTQKISLSGNAGVGWAETEISVNNVIATFKSPTVLGMVSYRLLLNDIEKYKDQISKQNYDDAAKKELMRFIYSDSTARVLSDKIARQEILDPTKPYEKKIIDAVEMYGFGYGTLSSNIKINRIPSTDYIDVAYRSTDPNISAEVVNTVGIEYLRFNENLNNQRGKQTADTIGSVMEAQQRRVDSLTNLLIDEKKRQGAVKPEDVSASAFQTVNQLETRLTEERARYNTASATYESLKKQLDILSGNVSSSIGATDEVIKLQSQKRELISKLNQGGNDADIRAQIDQINRKIATNAGNPTNTRKKEKIDDLNLQLAEQQGIINASSKTINELEGNIRSASGKTNLGAGSEIKLTTLWSSLDMENRQLVQIKDKYFQAQGMLKESPNTNFRQTLVGQPSSSPDPDRTFVNMGIAGTSAFMITSFLFLLGALLSNAVKTPSYFRKMTDIRLLAVVNKLNNRKGLPEMTQILSADAAMRNSANDHFRESMRKLRFAIENSGKRKILFTSLKSNTGKTTLIQALAQTMKLSRKKVLLIDTNFSNNSLSHIYAVQAYLEDSAKMPPQSEQIRKLISKTDDPFIDIIGSRGGSYTPSEILPHHNLLGHLDELLSEYDYIILEGPALNNHTDSQELIRYVDGVVAVFSADEQISPSDNMIMQYLEDLDEKLIGAVLNDVNLEDVEA